MSGEGKGYGEGLYLSPQEVRSGELGGGYAPPGKNANDMQKMLNFVHILHSFVISTRNNCGFKTYLQVKLCDPCLSALSVPPWPKRRYINTLPFLSFPGDLVQAPGTRRLTPVSGRLPGIPGNLGPPYSPLH